MAKKRIITFVLVLLCVGVLLGGGFTLGFNAGRKVPETVLVQGLTNIEGEKIEEVDFGTFWQAWKTIDEQYLDSEEVGAQERVYGAIRGLVGSLNDPYSEFFPPEENKKFQQDIQGSFGGIGAELGLKKNQLVVVAPLKDTPASRAGILAGDQILKINSTSTDGMSIETAVNLIRGPIGTEVVLNMYREGWERPKDIKITRATIIIPTLEATMIGDVVHIHLASFNANATVLFAREVAQALSSGAKGMVLDLRDNPGGYLDVAVDMAGWFVPRGSLVVSEKGRGGKVISEFRAHGNAALAEFPVVILMNTGSASASEILAGALRDLRKVQLVGTQSFGKGTVQQLETLRDGSSVKLTMAHWVFPNGEALDKVGLVPDVEVELTDEDIQKKKDPQLDKALEVLKEEIRK